MGTHAGAPKQEQEYAPDGRSRQTYFCNAQLSPPIDDGAAYVLRLLYATWGDHPWDLSTAVYFLLANAVEGCKVHARVDRAGGAAALAFRR